MTKRQKNIYLVAGVVVVVGVVVTFAKLGFSSPNETQEIPNVLPVNVQAIQESDQYRVTRRYSGILKAQKNSSLGFELGGRVIAVEVDEGDFVEEGDVIARLDTATLMAQRSAAVAREKEAKARLDEANAGPRKETVLAAKSNMLAARSEYENAKYTSQRRKQLAESQAISQEEYDQAAFAEQAALGRWRAAEERWKELEAGTRSEQKAAAEAALSQAKAAIQQIDVALEQSTVKAPFRGTVIQRFVDPGSIVNPGSEVVQLLQHEGLEAWFGLPVTTAGGLQKGETVTVTVDGVPYQGNIKAKIRTLSSSTRTQSVVVELTHSENAPIVAGQVCKLERQEDVAGAGYWIPTTALTQGVRGLWSVFVIEERDGKYYAQKRDVVVVYTDVDRSYVRGTLTGSSRVIIDGIHRIVPDQEVRPLDGDAKTSAQTESEKQVAQPLTKGAE